MIKEFLRKYLLGYAIALTVWGGLIYNNITDWESFCCDILWLTIVAHVIMAASVTGLVLHSVFWVRAVKAKERAKLKNLSR